ncbi:MAG: ATP-binding cassette domain-containing protein [Brachybacterium sp.]|uniref:ATP-binding cassette domain-containing protein n=1 Tax=Brachybacterium sp. TaxID=1891286 RepID=UPI002651890E|nr:ATP-binding cassette domain-containing protein [Brachybacterium sp.]MDN6303831.1 ATP-binding cassette domain-containing protein [Brachybacterium sp.]MDN6328132.1 ATP-binding cassette domain-containing protein [Brachybacterium sp.]MDN6399597.1 ATP-binding cassette domain-containing protein [Brachybacterium sp.]
MNTENTTHTTPLLEARGATRSLERSTLLVDIDLSVPEGEFLAVMGPSGCGKSPLLHTLSGLEDPTAGSVLWAGEDHSSLSQRARSRHRLLVADEPTGALDSAAGEEVMDALTEISARGTTIVLVTHDLDVARRADRIVNMADGRLSGELPSPPAA